MAGVGAGSSGLNLTSNVTVNGLAITGFSGYGLDITGSNNQVRCIWLGTADGLTAAPNGNGLHLGLNATNTKLGQPNLPETGNLISGNTNIGIVVDGGTNNALYYNWIGFQKDGVSVLRNAVNALQIKAGYNLKFVSGNRIHN